VTERRDGTQNGAHDDHALHAFALGSAYERVEVFGRVSRDDAAAVPEGEAFEQRTPRQVRLTDGRLVVKPQQVERMNATETLFAVGFRTLSRPARP
jgi:hypothetical protein